MQKTGKQHKFLLFTLYAVTALVLAFIIDHRVTSPAAFASDVRFDVHKNLEGDKRGLDNMIDEVWAQAARDNFDND
ncbi:hypothetical protein FPFC_040280 [Fructobacillus pseudoficulneus]|uniref:Uncharacterized protein n=1 Tax=Fructobacillus pseudoficulneus TaxID=220714 RepID=A0A3F3H3Q6_9LACO|nr:hypothetical protein [Fructobacillus pseudoficulneus]GAP03038.1 hypothetical protein FPFC_040280 [Fructobacillus pseudoficulneus]SEH41875.1 hypothetical protein SAMN05660469_0920 [Fructobacillus pseudoficulneus]